MMKKTMVFLLILSILLSLMAGCSEPDKDLSDDPTKKPAGNNNQTQSTTVTNPGNQNCEHSFADDGWQIVQESTCKEQGYQERACQKCSYTERQELPLGDHAYTAGVCGVCGDTIPASQGLQFVTEYKHYEWIAYFVGMGECTDTVVVVPAIVDQGGEKYPVSGIGMNAKFAENVTEITFLSPISDMPSFLFSNHAALTKITFAEGHSAIPQGTFSGCSALKEVILPSSLTGLGKNAFSGSALETITIPGGVQRLPEKLFDGCKALKTVILSEGLLRIDERAFQDCTALQSVTLPSTLNAIGGYAFYGCTALTEIVFSDALTSLSSFVCARAQSLKKVTLGDKVEIIGMCAFQNCFELEEITLPASVTSIARNAFSGCMKLGTIVFEGTMEQWNQITKGADWNDYCPATVVKCSDGDVAIG